MTFGVLKGPFYISKFWDGESGFRVIDYVEKFLQKSRYSRYLNLSPVILDSVEGSKNNLMQLSL
jgi:hypothetical protein